MIYIPIIFIVVFSLSVFTMIIIIEDKKKKKAQIEQEKKQPQSFDEQQKACKEYAEKKGYEIIQKPTQKKIKCENCGATYICNDIEICPYCNK